MNCKTGLGDAVDVQKPSVTITYPPANSAIREEFILAGTCSDDQGVAEITVMVYKDNKPVYGPYPAEIIADSTKTWKEGQQWKVLLNKKLKENPNPNPPLIPEYEFEIKDGTYTFQVQAKDTSGRVSDIVSSSFDIDNTALVLILNKPLAIAKETPSSYGRVFKLAGDTNDDHNITLSLCLKEVEGATSKEALESITNGTAVLGDPILFEHLNVSSMSSDAPLVVAQYYDNPKDEDQEELSNRYVKIYGEPKANGTNHDKYYYAGIRIMDKARIYRTPEEPNKETDGNKTSTYFINTKDLYKTLSGIGTDGVKAGDLKKILNGTDTNFVAYHEIVKTALAQAGNRVVCKGADDVAADRASVLSLNPDNSPTWSISGYAMGYENNPRADENSGYADYALGSTMNLTLSPNRDLTTIDPTSVSIWLEKYKYEDGNYVKDKSKEPIYLYDETGKNAEKLGGSASSDPISVTITKMNESFGLGAGEYYRIILKGKDFDDNDFASSNGTAGYGFKVASTDTPPTVRVTTNSPIKDQSIFKLADLVGGITIQVNIFEQTKKLGNTKKPDKVYCTVNGSDGAPAVTSTISKVSGEFGTSTNFVYEIKFNAASVSASEENYNYMVLIEAYNAVEKENPEPGYVNLEITGDNAAPEITIRKPAVNEIVKETSVEKVIENSVEKYKYTLSGNWKDENGSGTNKLWWSTDNSTWNEIDKNDLTQAAGQSSWSVLVDVNESTDANTFYLKGTDAAGNESAPVSVGGVKFDFEVPKCIPSNYNKITKNNPYTLSGTVTDSVSLAATPVSFVVNYKANESETFAAANTSDYVATPGTGGGKTANWSVQFKKDGIWQVKATAKDWVNRESAAWTSEEITVDSTAPVIFEDSTNNIKVTLEDQDWGANVWFKSATPRLKAQYTEDLSGIDNVYYWVNPDGTNVIENKIANASGTLSFSKNSKGKYEVSGAISPTKGSGFAAGDTNKLSFAAVDKAGNVANLKGPITVKVDIEKPQIKSDELTAKGTWLINGKSNITFSGKATDDAAGINKISIKLGSKTITSDTSSVTIANPGAKETDWTATFTVADLSGLSGNLDLIATVTDHANNENTNVPLCKVQIDTAPPTPTITSVANLAEGGKVNKIFTVGGTNSDTFKISNLVLKYKIEGQSEWQEFTGGVKTVDGVNEWDSAGTGGIVIAGDNSAWSVKIDSVNAFGSKNAAEDKTVTLLAISTDEAGNTSADTRTEAQTSFIVDQDTDRPIIALTTAVAEKGGSKYIGAADLVGSVIDDDGTVSEVYISTSEMTFDANGVRTNGGKKVDNTGWTFPLGDDGTKNLYFYVKDAADGVFSYKYDTSSGDIGKHGCLRFKESNAAAVTDLTSAFTFVKDVAPPTIASGKATYGSTTEVLTTSLYLGGTERNAPTFKFNATDNNGVKSMSVVITNTSVTPNTEYKYSTETLAGYTTKGSFTSGNDATWTLTASDVDFTSWVSGDYTFAVTATDTGGSPATKNFQVKVDFTAPTVTSFGPNDAIVVKNTITATFSDTTGVAVGKEIKDIKWIIPTKAQNTNDTSRNAITTWNNTAGNKVSVSIPLTWAEISKYSNTTASTGYATDKGSGILEVPVLFKLTDHIGNTGYVEKTFTIDSNKSLPTTTTNYPANNAKVGNTTTIYGSAVMLGESDASPAVKETRLQIDANGDGSYTIADLLILCGHDDGVLRTALTDDQKTDNRNNWKSWALQESDARPDKPRLVAKDSSGDDLITKNAAGELVLASNIATADVVKDWYVVANGTSDWNILIKTSLFNDSYTGNISVAAGGTLVNPIVNIRAKAYGKVTGFDGLKKWNNTEHIRAWDATEGVAALSFTVDTGVPPRPDMYVVQYSSTPTAAQIADGKAADDLITISLPYKDGMYISPKVGNGKWYFKTTIEDETALDNYSLSKNSGATVNNKVFKDQSKEGISNSGDVKKWNICAQLTDTATKDGKIYLTLDFFDKSGKSQSVNIDIRTDATAPTIAEAADETAADSDKTVLLKNESGKMIGDVADDVAYIEETDGAFTLVGDKNSIVDSNTAGKDDAVLEDAVSKLKYVAFWFERKASASSSTKDRLINPMLTTSNETNLENLTAFTADGFVGESFTNLPRPSKTEITLDTSSKPNIRRGGLVKIGGVYVMIKNISDSTITLSEEVETKFKSADFIYAQVVNQTEGNEDDGSYDDSGAIDGDGIKDLLNVSDGNWSAKFHSTNMADGPVYVHITAIDNAGNVSKASVKTTVTNNRPRITKVMVGTDWNRDNNYKITDDITGLKRDLEGFGGTARGTRFGGFAYYHTIESSRGNENVTGKPIATVGSETNPFVVPHTLCVIPEFTGGNGTLQYTMDIWDEDKDTRITGDTEPLLRGETALHIVYEGDDSKKSEALAKIIQSGTNYGGVIIGETTKIGGKTLSEHDPTGKEPIKYIAFTFWDEASETTPGTDSLWALLKVAVKLKVNEKNKPIPVIKPFHWNSKADNSVHKDEKGNLLGHIELEGDLTSGLTTAYGTGDPKVSGAIIVDGVAKDDVQLSTIGISFEGITDLKSRVDVLEYTNGKWNEISENVGTGKSVLAAEATSIINDTDLTARHTANFKIAVNTEKLSTVVGKDKAIRVYATDWKGNEYVLDTTKTQTTSAKYTDYYKVDVVPYVTSVTTSLSNINRKVPSVFDRTSSGHYPVYVHTTYSELKAGETRGEKITFNGFNLSGGSVTTTVKDKNDKTFTLTGKTGTLDNDMATGKWTVTVTSGGTAFTAVNNLNNNEAKGTYSHTSSVGKTGSKTIYDNYYNRQPNGQNNNLLTDDLEFDVWEFNNRAAVPISGKIEQPHMKIDPVTGQIGFAFVNGPLYFSMPGVADSNATTGADNTKTSYNYWCGSYDFFTSVSLAYDDLGNSYATAAGGDINSDPSTDRFIFMSNRFGHEGRSSGGAYGGHYRLEAIGERNADGVTNFDKQRIKSPTIATSVKKLTNSKATNVYLAYYDQINSEIRFNYGTYFDSDDDKSALDDWETAYTDYNIEFFDNNPHFAFVIGSVASCYNGRYGDKIQLLDENGNVIDKDGNKNGTATYYAFYDNNHGTQTGTTRVKGQTQDNTWTHPDGDNYVVPETNNYCWVGISDNRYATTNLGIPYTARKLRVYKNKVREITDTIQENAPAYRVDHVQVVASGNLADRKPGQYVSLGVVPGSTLTDDVVVMCWYDETNRQLLYSYTIRNPLGIKKGDTTAAGWSSPKAIFDGKDFDHAGEYCQIAVDKNKGIHIAACDPVNCDLVYAYAPSYSGAFTSCVVDANGVLGSNITLDVGLNSSNKPVPHIGYYATSAVRPKHAYIKDTAKFYAATDAIVDGAIDEEFTGIWECAVVPTPSTINMQSNQYNKINVGVWKNDSGNIIANSNTNPSSTGGSGTDYKATSYGYVYGNTTSNAVLGYTIKVTSSSDAIETAQMR